MPVYKILDRRFGLSVWFIFTVSYPSPPLSRGNKELIVDEEEAIKNVNINRAEARSELRLLQFIHIPRGSRPLNRGSQPLQGHTASTGAHSLYRGSRPLQGLMASTGGFFWPLCIWGSFFAGALQGLCHEMNNFLKAYSIMINTYVLSVHALIVLNFFFLLEGKNQTQSFS